MSRPIGNDDEMLHLYPSDEQAEALIRGEEPQDPDLVDMADLLGSLRSLRHGEIAEETVDRHVAMIAREASVSPRVGSSPELIRPSNAPRTRRRLVLSSLLSSMLVKVFAASVAVAAVGTGLGVAADNAVPGDALSGLDRAMESVGLGDGGAAERLEEAQSLVDIDLPGAVGIAGESVGTLGDEDAAAALLEAADRIRNAGAEQSQPTREAVGSLLDLISQQLADDGLVGADIAEAARAIGDTVTVPAQVPDDVPADDIPAEDVPADDVPPDDVPPEDVPPDDVPPEDPPPDQGDAEEAESPPISPPTTRP